MSTLFNALATRYLPGLFTPPTASDVAPAPDPMPAPPLANVVQLKPAPGRLEQLLRKRQAAPARSLSFRQFQQTTRTLRADILHSDIAVDALRVAGEARRDTDAMLVQYRRLLDPQAAVNPATALQQSMLSHQILSSVAFELDCLETLAAAIRGLRQSDQTKLAASRTVVAQDGGQTSTLMPLLSQREKRSASFQALRGKEEEQVRQMIALRTNHIVAQLVPARRWEPD